MKELIEYRDVISVLITTIISTIFACVVNKVKEYTVKTRNEKAIKKSVLGDILEKHIMSTLIRLLVFVVLVINAAILFAYIDVLNDINVSYLEIYLVLILAIIYIIGELIPKIRKNRKDFMNHLVYDKKKINKNIFIFYLPSTVIILTIIFLVLFKISTNFMSTLIVTTLIWGSIFFSMRHLNCKITENRYSKVIIYFNNSFPPRECDYKSLTEIGSSYITIVDEGNKINGLTKYNNDIITGSCQGSCHIFLKL